MITTGLALQGRMAFTYDGPVFRSCGDDDTVQSGVEPSAGKSGATGLDYFEARYMSSAQGRFTSPDPLGGKLEDPQTLNKYTYARNNPLAFTDPTGLYVCGSSMSADQCAGFEKSRQEAQAAADKLKEKYGADSKKYLDAQGAIASYGIAGVDNGVTIEVAANNGKSGVDIGNSRAQTDDNPTGRNIIATFDPGSLGKEVSTAGLIAHEGTHVADAERWSDFGFAAAQHPIAYAGEMSAYRNQTAILEGAYLGAADRGEASGYRLTGLFSYGGNTRMLWSPGWSDANVANAIKGWVGIPPAVGGIYGLTPASKTLMFRTPK
jgi:RHS repeat-associated protein